ncbi:MAG: hypothetical protein EPN21_19080 [Methylococcaceae bacterium]|nr:MAG: hypothetical protein EPN21_19080 [Methylococcaceae bacterium]
MMQTAAQPSLPLAALFTELERLDIKLWLEADRLRFNAPPGALTAELRSRLQTHKAELIAYLHRAGIHAPEDRMSLSHDASAQHVSPPSFAQRHFGTLQRQNPTACYYNVPFGFHCRGPLDENLLRQSFNATIARHEFLRTTLQDIDGALMQVVAPAGEIHMTVVPLQQLNATDLAAAIEREIQTECHTPFDLAAESGLRIRLLRLAQEEYVLLICLHNVAFDTGSLSALLHEVGEHYAALAGGQPARLPALPMQYADCVRWQQALLNSNLEPRLAYWRQWFSRGEPPPVTLLIAKQETPSPSFHAGTLRCDYAPQLTQQLKQLSQQAGVTLFATLLAAYALTLYRFSSIGDVVMGTTFANRSHWKQEPLIGSLLNILALRIDLSGSPDFLSVLKQVREVFLAACSHQDVPFAAIAPILQPDQQRTTPLFRTVFSFLGEIPGNQLQFPGIEVSFMEKIHGELMFPDLYPTMWEKKTADGMALTGYWQYKQDLYSAATASALLDYFSHVLQAAVANPRLAIDTL